mgnify:CR=1 FL=1
MIYATEVIVKKIQRFTTEIKDKEYDKESVFIEHYQYDLFDRLTKKSTLDGSYTTFSYNKDNSIAKEEKYNS